MSGGAANHRKGAETERMVAKYLRPIWPEVDRRLREGRADDQGDLDGVPGTTVQVKYVQANRYQEWVEGTLRQRDNAGNPYCLLIRRVPRKPVEQWEAMMPAYQVGIRLEEGQVSGWIRMELGAAVRVMQMLHAGHWLPSSPTTE